MHEYAFEDLKGMQVRYEFGYFNHHFDLSNDQSSCKLPNTKRETRFQVNFLHKNYTNKNPRVKASKGYKMISAKSFTIIHKLAHIL